MQELIRFGELAWQWTVHSHQVALLLLKGVSFKEKEGEDERYYNAQVIYQSVKKGEGGEGRTFDIERDDNKSER